MTHVRHVNRSARILLTSVATAASVLVAMPAASAMPAALERPAAAALERPAASPADQRRAFLARIAPAAREARAASGVPVSVAMAQAIIESGWGRSSLTTRSNNYFGLKCSGSRGTQSSGCVRYGTQEHVRGTSIATVSGFRSYPTAKASFVDYGRFLRSNSRYAGAFRYQNNPERFVQEIQRAGYATDPAYSAKLIQIMRQFNLYRYDR